MGVVHVHGEGSRLGGLHFHVEQSVAVWLWVSTVHRRKETTNLHPAVRGEELAQSDVVDVPAWRGVICRRVAVPANVVVLHHKAELHPLTHIIAQINRDVGPPAGVVGGHRRAAKGGLSRSDALTPALNLTLIVAFGVQTVSKTDVGGIGLVDGNVTERVGAALIGREELVVALTDFDVGAVAVVLLDAT